MRSVHVLPRVHGATLSDPSEEGRAVGECNGATMSWTVEDRAPAVLRVA